MSKWIPVTSSLPTNTSIVIIARSNRQFAQQGYYTLGKWYDYYDGTILIDVRYWQAMPEPPNG